MSNIAVAALLLAISACGAPAPSPPTAPSAEAPDSIWRLIGADGTARNLLIYDTAGLLAGMRLPTASTNRRGNAWWHPVSSDPNALVVGWLGGVCGIEPTLHVHPDGRRVSLTIFDGHIPRTGGVCPTVATTYEVVLEFRESVSQFDVSVVLTEEPQGR